MRSDDTSRSLACNVDTLQGPYRQRHLESSCCMPRWDSLASDQHALHLVSAMSTWLSDTGLRGIIILRKSTAFMLYTRWFRVWQSPWPSRIYRSTCVKVPISAPKLLINRCVSFYKYGSFRDCSIYSINHWKLKVCLRNRDTHLPASQHWLWTSII